MFSWFFFNLHTHIYSKLKFTGAIWILCLRLWLTFAEITKFQMIGIIQQLFYKIELSTLYCWWPRFLESWEAEDPYFHSGRENSLQNAGRKRTYLFLRIPNSSFFFFFLIRRVSFVFSSILSSDTCFWLASFKTEQIWFKDRDREEILTTFTSAHKNQRLRAAY